MKATCNVIHALLLSGICACTIPAAPVASIQVLTLDWRTSFTQDDCVVVTVDSSTTWDFQGDISGTGLGPTVPATPPTLQTPAGAGDPGGPYAWDTSHDAWCYTGTSMASPHARELLFPAGGYTVGCGTDTAHLARSGNYHPGIPALSPGPDNGSWAWDGSELCVDPSKVLQLDTNAADFAGGSGTVSIYTYDAVAGGRAASSTRNSTSLSLPAGTLVDGSLYDFYASFWHPESTSGEIPGAACEAGSSSRTKVCVKACQLDCWEPDPRSLTCQRCPTEGYCTECARTLPWKMRTSGSLLQTTYNGSYHPTAMKWISNGNSIVPVRSIYKPDFNGDNHSDMFLYDRYTRRYYAVSFCYLYYVYCTGFPADGWGAVGCADFNGDGRDDLLMERQLYWAADGRWYNYYAAKWGPLSTSAGGDVQWGPVSNGWRVLGRCCANANPGSDNTRDLWFHNSETNHVANWLCGPGGTITGGGTIACPPAGWRVHAIRNSRASTPRCYIYWRNSSTGAAAAWECNGTAVTNSVSLYDGGDWDIAGYADTNGDKIDDMLWRNKTTGAVSLWLMNADLSVSSNACIYDGAGGWVPAGRADFNGDGKDDLIFQNPADGHVVGWGMNGTTVTGSGPLN